MQDDSIERARQASVLVQECLDVLQRAINGLRLDIQNLESENTDLRERAENFERRYDEAKDKAQLTDALAHHGRALVEAIDRLPVRMEDAGLIQTPTPPHIPLYGTWDWQAVIDEKFALDQLLQLNKHTEGTEMPQRGTP